MADEDGRVYPWPHTRLFLSPQGTQSGNGCQPPGGKYLPTGGLEGHRLIDYQLGMGADGLWVHRSAVHMSMVVASLTISNNLQWLTELHNLRGKASEA